MLVATMLGIMMSIPALALFYGGLVRSKNMLTVLIVGAFAERMKFSAVLLFAALWFAFAYLPMAHMVWFWPGPDAFTDADAGAAAVAASGWLFQKGALDFAGGTVVHINAGVAGLVGAYLIGKRIGYGKE